MFFKPNSSKDVLLHLLTVLLLSAGILFFIFYVYLPHATKADVVTLTNLEGLSIEEAEKWLSDRNLRYEVNKDSGYNEDIEPLAVLSQFPVKDSKVKEKRLVYLTLNTKRPPLVKMPRLIDLSLTSAQLKLKSLGLKIGSREYKPDPALNAVLEQRVGEKTIEPGTPVHKGTVINLILGDGLGRNQIKMPNLSGMMLDEAETYIEGTGLKIGLILEETNPDKIYPGDSTGTVTRHVPNSAEDVRLGDVVDIWVKNYEEYKSKREKDLMENDHDD